MKLKGYFLRRWGMTKWHWLRNGKYAHCNAGYTEGEAKSTLPLTEEMCEVCQKAYWAFRKGTGGRSNDQFS